MNWDAIGAIAELIAAIAVLATLVYLAAQIKQNTKALSGASMDSITSHGFQELQWSAELQPVFVKAEENPDSLEEIERRQILCWVIAALRNRQNEYFQWKHGSLDSEIVASSEAIIAMILSTPLAGEWFRSEQGRSTLAPDFYQHAESIRRRYQGDT